VQSAKWTQYGSPILEKNKRFRSKNRKDLKYDEKYHLCTKPDVVNTDLAERPEVVPFPHPRTLQLLTPSIDKKGDTSYGRESRVDSLKEARTSVDG